MNFQRLKELQQFKGKVNSEWPCTGDELAEMATTLMILINEMYHVPVESGDGSVLPTPFVKGDKQ